MFGSALQLGHDAVLGIIGVLVSTFLQAVSSVWVKRIDGKIPALSQVTGGLLLSLPVYLITWATFDGHWPTEISPVSLASIVYLGAIATTIGFVLYYYLLIHQSATKVSLVTLISPVMALLLGHAVNHEPLTMKVATGTLLILGALLMHEFSARLAGSKQTKPPIIHRIRRIFSSLVYRLSRIEIRQPASAVVLKIRTQGFNPRLDYAHQYQDQQDNQQQPKPSAGSIAPSPAMRPRWDGSDQQNN